MQKGEEQTKLNVLLLVVVVDKKVCTRINKTFVRKGALLGKVFV